MNFLRFFELFEKYGFRGEFSPSKELKALSIMEYFDRFLCEDSLNFHELMCFFLNGIVGVLPTKSQCGKGLNCTFR